MRLGAAVVAAALLLAPGRARADASPALQSVLAEMRTLSDVDFKSVVAWAGKGAQPPVAPAAAPERTETDILALERRDRRAVIGWLQGKGRAVLYARGATDDEIGAKYRLVSPEPSATPNSWRGLPLAAAGAGGAQGRVQILAAFAKARRDGTGAVACVTFKNVARIAATRVVIDFPLLTTAGETLGDLTVDRHGNFLPNVAIADTCTHQDLPAPALALLQARLASYRVTRVEYTDGTVWPPGAPSSSPQP